MSGHSKWHSIKHKKGAADAKRGKIFTRHAKLIEIAAREGGGGDPDSNPSLRTAIDSAKADNVPNANIDRAVKKGTGELKDAAQTVAVTYEAYGPGGSAFIIECLTDNKNRTLPNVKSIIDKQGGRFAESNSVAWMFERKGIVIAEKKEGEVELPEETELELIDAGAEEIDTSGNTIIVTAGMEAWSKVRDALKNHGYTIDESGLKYEPKDAFGVGDVEIAKKVLSFMDALEEDEDVSEVHTNADISEDIASQIE